MQHEIQKAIVLKLIHTPRANYNQLWDKKIESNLFAYHLKKLEDEGIVQKFEDGYGLTREGKKLSAFIEGDTGGKAALPTPTVILLVRKGEKILCQERLKEPFFGYWSWVSGKINFGWNPEECALRDLKEEAGLDAQHATIRAIEHVKTYDENNTLLHHHLIWVYEITEFTGELIEKTHKARNMFLTIDQYREKKRFPGEWSFDTMMKTDSFYVVEIDRSMKDGQFVEGRVIRTEEFKKK